MKVRKFIKREYKEEFFEKRISRVPKDFFEWGVATDIYDRLLNIPELTTNDDRLPTRGDRLPTDDDRLPINVDQ